MGHFCWCVAVAGQGRWRGLLLVSAPFWAATSAATLAVHAPAWVLRPQRLPCAGGRGQTSEGVGPEIVKLGMSVGWVLTVVAGWVGVVA